MYTSRIVSARQSLTLPELYRQFGFSIPRVSPEEGSNRERKERLGVGSGVIISADGYIVTNNHVVQGMRGREVDEILVRLNDDTEYVATLIGSDSKTDVAILKVDADESLPAVTLADSDLLRVGTLSLRLVTRAIWDSLQRRGLFLRLSVIEAARFLEQDLMRTLFRPTQRSI